MRLWVKIFVWFSLAMGFVAASLALSVYLTAPDFPGQRQNRPGMGRWKRFTSETVGRHAREVAEQFQQGGPEAARRYLSELEESQGIVASLYGADNRPIAGPPLESADLDLLEAARNSRRMQFREQGSTLLVARRPPPLPGGNELVLVGWFPRPGSGPDAWGLILRLTIVLVTGAVLCYGLARYLTAPAAKLQRAVRQLASGQLDARVGGSMGNRRDELADLGRDFDGMAERIQQLVESQSRLIRDISHELRSPLARLNVALELARRRAGPEAEGAIDRIAAESERMNQLIGQLLSLSRLESSPEGIRREPVPFQPLLESLVEDAGFEASGKACTVGLQGRTSASVLGAPDLLRSALENVLRNAVRYSPRGGRIGVEIETLEADGQSRLAIIIQDEGPGVPEESLQEIFLPFFRVGESRDRDTGGSGLGLAIASRVVKFHGGRLSARNLKPGLQVRLELPIVPPIPTGTDD